MYVYGKLVFTISGRDGCDTHIHTHTHSITRYIRVYKLDIRVPVQEMGNKINKKNRRRSPLRDELNILYIDRYYTETRSSIVFYPELKKNSFPFLI